MFIQALEKRIFTNALRNFKCIAHASVRFNSNHILTTKNEKIFAIQLNKPEKKNALSKEMYETITNSLREANEDNTTTLTVIHSAGDDFCSGNDLTNFTRPEALENLAEYIKRGLPVLKNFVQAHIEHKKPLVTLVQGPAIGIAMTILGLSDLVYASDRATFHAPLTVLGQTPEGCSSYTFPRMMGINKASELLLFGKKLNAQQAMQRNIVTDVFHHLEFEEKVWRLLHEYATLPPESLQYSKSLVRQPLMEELIRISDKESERLQERWLSEECMLAIARFFAKQMEKKNIE